MLSSLSMAKYLTNFELASLVYIVKQTLLSSSLKGCGLQVFMEMRLQNH